MLKLDVRRRFDVVSVKLSGIESKRGLAIGDGVIEVLLDGPAHALTIAVVIKGGGRVPCDQLADCAGGRGAASCLCSSAARARTSCVT